VVLEFYDSELKRVVKTTSAFSQELVPRAGEQVFLPPDIEGLGGGTYEVTNVRHLYWADPHNADCREVRLSGMAVYVKRVKEDLEEPIPRS
jgi:hypothetical protein